MKPLYSNDKKFIAQIQKIELQINQNQLQEAVQQLNLLVKEVPGDPRLFLLASRLAQAAHNPEGVLQAAVKAYQLAPQWPVASIFLAGVLADRGQTVEALTLATQAIQQATQQKTLDHELLVKAADLAYQLGQYPQALVWLRQAGPMKPADTATSYRVGLTLSANGDFGGAIDILTDVLSQLPGNPAVLIARRQAALGAQNMSMALQDAEALLAQDPTNEEHPFFLAIARGETPKTQPASGIAVVFDRLANQYDAQRGTAARYTLPQDVARLIHGWYPSDDADILELGCGTGLLGASLGPRPGVLVGVDLSTQMVAQAIRRQVYDKFHTVNLLDALRDTPADQYHVIAALDVFGYVGDLTSVVPNALRILLPGGRFVFTCEASANDDSADYRLPASYRYTHQRGYLLRLLQEAGFKDVDLQDHTLRYEAGTPVQGFLVVAHKPIVLDKKTGRRPPKVVKTAHLAD